MSLMLPKSPRVELPRHLDRIREMSCLICRKAPPSEASHLRMGLGGGVGMKPHDYWTLPLCHSCHDKAGKNERAFWAAQLSINKELLVRVLRAFARSLYQDEMTDR